MRQTNDPLFIDKAPGFFPHGNIVRFVLGANNGGILPFVDPNHGKVRLICAAESQAVIQYTFPTKATPQFFHLKKGRVLWLSQGCFLETSLSICAPHLYIPDCPEARPTPPTNLTIMEQYELLTVCMQRFLLEPLVHDGEFHQERRIAQELRKNIIEGMLCVEKGIPIPADCSFSRLSEQVNALLDAFHEGKESASKLPSASD